MSNAAALSGFVLSLISGWVISFGMYGSGVLFGLLAFGTFVGGASNQVAGSILAQVQEIKKK